MLPARDPHGWAKGIHLVFQASPVAVRDSLSQMLAMRPLLDLSPDARGTAELVLAEVLNNVAEHAYVDGTGPVEVTLTPVAAGLCCLVVDQGSAMPGDQLPDGTLPEVDSTLEGLPEGGFGWHLIRTLTRDLAYRRSDGRNRLSFVLPRDS